jgi:hypothetical protein
MNHAIAMMTDPALLSMLFLLGSLAWMLLDQKDKARAIFFLAMLANVFYGAALSRVLGVESASLPWKFDRYLYHIDAALGISAAAVARAIGPAPLLRMVYCSLVPVMILWYAIHRRRQGSPLLLAYAAEMVMGPCFYALLPACGPVYAWGAAWLRPAGVALVPIRLDAAPNAFPSLHFATALLLVLFAAGRSRRILALLYAGVTALATLTTGEHYIIDLVAAVPFACAAADLARANLKLAAVHVAAVLAWLCAIRFATPAMAAHPYVLRTLALVTLAIGAQAVAGAWHEQRAIGPVAARALPDAAGDCEVPAAI